eukprot:scaffold6652_cov62-Phaeocystis_antarctica.AAC.7
MRVASSRAPAIEPCNRRRRKLHVVEGVTNHGGWPGYPEALRGGSDGQLEMHQRFGQFVTSLLSGASSYSSHVRGCLPTADGQY